MVSAGIDISDEEIRRFCQRWQVHEFSLFGSILRPDFSDSSDVDVMLSFESGATWDYWVGWPEMQDELTRIFGRKVDCVIKESLRNPIRRNEILSNSRVIYGHCVH